MIISQDNINKCANVCVFVCVCVYLCIFCPIPVEVNSITFVDGLILPADPELSSMTPLLLMGLLLEM